MARTLSLPAARSAPNVTLIAWGGITLLGSLLLPWARTGRDLFEFVPGTAGAQLLRESPLIAAVAVAAALVVLLGMMPRPHAEQGRIAVGLGASGAVLVLVYLYSAGQPAGPAVPAAIL
ncbi:MAG TPA: hypothetical protein VGK88_14410, partial [bacterium]